MAKNKILRNRANHSRYACHAWNNYRMTDINATIGIEQLKN